MRFVKKCLAGVSDLPGLVIRFVVLLMPAVLMAAVAVRRSDAGEGTFLLWLGTTFELCVCFLMFFSRGVWRPASSGTPPAQVPCQLRCPAVPAPRQLRCPAAPAPRSPRRPRHAARLPTTAISVIRTPSDYPAGADGSRKAGGNVRINNRRILAENATLCDESRMADCARHSELTWKCR